MMLYPLFLLVTLTLPGPSLIPTEADFCPSMAILEEETFPQHRAYRCKTESGMLLWEKRWCPVVPRKTAQIAVPACTQPDPTGAGPWGLLGVPHFHCDLPTLTWRLQCHDGQGVILWDVAL